MLSAVGTYETKKDNKEVYVADGRQCHEKSIEAVDANSGKNSLKDKNPMTQGMTPRRRPMINGHNGMVARGSNACAVDGLQDSGTNLPTSGTAVHHHQRPSRNVSKTRQKLPQWFRLCFGRFLEAREVKVKDTFPSSSWKNTDDVRSWENFDVFRVDEETNEKSLEVVFMELIDIFKLTKSLNLDRSACRQYIRAIQENYKQNAYHNRIHAADVLQSVGVILFSGCIYKRFEKLEILAMILAAAVHDVCHPGVNNEYHKKTKSELTKRYTDSLNERMHIDRAYEILTKTGENHMLKNLKRKDASHMRDCIEAIIIATDMAGHKKLVSDFGERFPAHKANFKSKKLCPHDRMLLLQMVVHCADISNPMRPMHLCETWSEMITEENCLQGDMERSENHPVTNGCDRAQANRAVSQKGFLESFVVPCFQTFGRVVPSFAEMALRIAKENLRNWQRKIDFPEEESTGA